MPSTAASHFSHLYASTSAKYCHLPVHPFIYQYLCQLLAPRTAAIYMPVLLPSSTAYLFSHLYASTSAKYCSPPQQPFICKYFCQVMQPPTAAIYMQVLLPSTARLPLQPFICTYLCQVLTPYIMQDIRNYLCKVLPASHCYQIRATAYASHCLY